MSSPADEKPPGLRERKKAQTRAAIQSAALHLFERQGYGETTIDQIAERADVSQSTFFRYFPTKEDVVLHDRYDPLLLAAFRAQPAELGPIAALRRTMRGVLSSLPAGELAQERQRGSLIISVPELRARALDQLAGTLLPFAEAVAARTGQPIDAAPVRGADRRHPRRRDRCDARRRRRSGCGLPGADRRGTRLPGGRASGRAAAARVGD